MIKTAVVILNWNGINFLKSFLRIAVKYSLSKTTEIIVADNGSTDNSINWIKENFPEIRLIIFDKNYGFTGGYNKALEQIDAEYFILLNSDVEVTENWIEPIISMMDDDDSIAAAMPKIISYSNKENFEYAGASGGFIDKYGYPFCRGRIISTVEEDKGQYNNISEIFWASGASLFIRAELFKKVGGLDNDFFAHMEEIDLCWRLKSMGYKILVNPKSIVYHVGGGTLPNNSPAKIFFNYRNNLLLLLKNLPKNRIIPIIFSRMILDGLSAFVYFASLKFGFFFAVIKAHFSFYGKISKTLKKRSSQTCNNHREIYKRSIVFDYFLNKKSTFNKLNINSNKEQ